jgi:enoyl-CoA hydratase/carnithine racemase
MSANSHLAGQSSMIFETLRVRREEAVLFVEISAPPMNLLGPELVRDLVSLIQRAEADDTIQVLVFKSADPDYFISHVDVNKIKEYRQEAAKLTGEASIALLFRHLSASRLVTIAQIEGRVRGAGSEFVLACDTRFAARESAIFSQPEPALGQIPGGGGVQHLARLIGRARALEVMLGAQDYNAQLAERYGWINRALPASTLSDFVRSLALRIAKFPSSGIVAVKERVMSSFPRAMLITGWDVRILAGWGYLERGLRGGGRRRCARLAGWHHVAERWILGTGRPLFAVRVSHHRPCVGRGREPGPPDPKSCYACGMVRQPIRRQAFGDHDGGGSRAAR